MAIRGFDTSALRPFSSFSPLWQERTIPPRRTTRRTSRWRTARCTPTIDDFTDEVLATTLACLAGTEGFRVEYIYETGEHRLTVPASGGVVDRRVTLDFRSGRRPAFSFTATLSRSDASVLLADALPEQFIGELTVDEPDVLIYRTEKGPTRRVPLPAEGMPMLIEEFQRRIADQMLIPPAPSVPASPSVRASPPAPAPTVEPAHPGSRVFARPELPAVPGLPVSPAKIAPSFEPEPPTHSVLLAIRRPAPIVEPPRPGKAFTPPELPAVSGPAFVAVLEVYLILIAELLLWMRLGSYTPPPAAVEAIREPLAIERPATGTPWGTAAPAH